MSKIACCEHCINEPGFFGSTCPEAKTGHITSCPEGCPDEPFQP
jgi:hypothetical protein